MQHNEILIAHLNESIHAKQNILRDDALQERILQAGALLSKTLQQGKTLYFAGNGGSASDAQHISAEFVGRFVSNRRPLPSVALNTDVAAITAISNDFGYDEVFARQLMGLGFAGDAFIGISTSGTSNNILKAFSVAKEKGMKSVFLTSEKIPNELADIADVVISVPTSQTTYIQESHIMIGHIICKLVENSVFQIENWIK